MTNTNHRLLFAWSLLAVAAVFGALSAGASSHREAPGILSSPQIDGTDFYMFRSYEEGRDGFVTLIADYNPLQDPYGGPNYFSLDPEARYRVNIENDGDLNGSEDIVFEFQFFNTLNTPTVSVGGQDVAHPLRTITPLAGGITPNEDELYTVRVIRGDDPPQFATNGTSGDTFFVKALDYFGEKTFADYDVYASDRIAPIQIPGCDDGRVFVGQRKEPFAANLGEIFDLINLNPVGGNRDEKPSSTQGKNITSLVLEVPTDCLTGEYPGLILKELDRDWVHVGTRMCRGGCEKSAILRPISLDFESSGCRFRGCRGSLNQRVTRCAGRSNTPGCPANLPKTFPKRACGGAA